MLKQVKNCKTCGKEYSTSGKYFCSRKCQPRLRQSEEVRRKMSLILIGNTRGRGGKGRKLSEEHKRKIGLVHKGKTITLQMRLAVSKAHKGKPRSEEIKKKISETTTGKRKSDEHRAKFKGDKNPAWKGGVTPINAIIRRSFEYKQWRLSVFKRDRFTCVFCGFVSKNGKEGKIHADHIKPFAFYPELRFEISNGRTLCIECHKKTHTWGSHKNYREPILTAGAIGIRGDNTDFEADTIDVEPI